MSVPLFPRFHMELQLRGQEFEVPPLPEGFHARPWHPTLLEAFITTHYLSFRNETDARLFTSFQTLRGARRVVEYIVGKRGFLPEATWLIEYMPCGEVGPVYCASIQGAIDSKGHGAIQNIGVVPKFRGRKLAAHCLLRAVQGFQQAGVPVVHLEVTATNEDALRLYRGVGFEVTRSFQRRAQ